MAKNKYKLAHVHKIKIHYNRWLIWAVAYLLFIFVSLLGYIQVTDLNLETEHFLAESAFTSWHPYRNQDLGFSLRYPADWSIEPDSENGIDFVPEDLSRAGVNISVYDPSDYNAIRRSLEIDSEDPILVDGVKGTEISSLLAEGKTRETFVIVENNDNLYVLRGPRVAVRQFVQTFNFIE
jgi:hypothetical protein